MVYEVYYNNAKQRMRSAERLKSAYTLPRHSTKRGNRLNVACPYFTILLNFTFRAAAGAACPIEAALSLPCSGLPAL